MLPRFSLDSKPFSWNPAEYVRQLFFVPLAFVLNLSLAVNACQQASRPKLNIFITGAHAKTVALGMFSATSSIFPVFTISHDIVLIPWNTAGDIISSLQQRHLIPCIRRVKFNLYFPNYTSRPLAYH